MTVGPDDTQGERSPESRYDLAFERSVLANPAAHTYEAVRMAGEVVFARLDALTAMNKSDAGERSSRLRNPFRVPLLKRQFDACVFCYFSKHKDLFRADGTRNMSNGVANQFWWGVDGVREPHQWDAGSRQSPAYAAYRAGQMIAAYEKVRNEANGQEGNS